jgi:AcrR family transcriptional regulator
MLLDVALTLFVRHGYRGTSMDQIADAAGVTKPVVYDCFPNKEALFDAVLEREQQRLVEHALAALPDEVDAGDVERTLAHAYTALLTAVEASPDSWRVLSSFEYASEPKIAERVQEGRRTVTDRVLSISRAWLVRQGAPDAERLAKLYAYLIVGTSEASVRLILDEPDAWRPQELGEAIARAISRPAGG